MRNTVIALAVVGLAWGLWSITDDPERRRRSTAPAATEPVVVARENRSPTVAAGARASFAPEEPPPTGDPIDAPVLLPHQVPATPIAQALADSQLPPMPELLKAERAFAAERIDPLWASAMEGQILGEIARTGGLQPVTLQVECRTSMCRVQLVHPQSQGAEPRIVFPSVGTAWRPSDPRLASFNHLVSTLALDPRWVASVVDRNGTPTSLAYLARRERAP